MTDCQLPPLQCRNQLPIVQKQSEKGVVFSTFLFSIHMIFRDKKSQIKPFPANIDLITNFTA